MNSKFDPRLFLQFSFIYTTYQKLVGGYRARRLFVENNVKVKPHQKILDIGCGPGDILDFLPKADYLGIDEDANYIETAKRKFSNQGSFICSGIKGFKLIEPGIFDIVISSGVLHHLDNNEAKELFQIAHEAMKPNGRLITYDGCYINNQNFVSRTLLKLDRGNFVRTKTEYEALAKSCFKNVTSLIEEDYFHVPYTSIIMECKKQ